MMIMGLRGVVTIRRRDFIMIKKILSSLVMGSLLVTSSFIDAGSKVEAAEVNSIPNTTKVEKSYDSSFLSVSGYARR